MSAHEQAIASAQKAALKAHNEGDLVTAEKLYRKILARPKRPRPEIYGNYGALLRHLEKPKQSASVYRRGLKIYPKEILLLRNFGNLMLQEGHYAKALALYLKSEEILMQNNKLDKINSIRRQQAEVLAELGQPKMALRILEPILSELKNEDCNLKLGMADLYLELDDLIKAKELALPILTSREPSIGQAYQWSNLLLKLGEFEKALEKFDHATSIHRKKAAHLDAKSRQKFDTTCWNFSLMLLRRGLFRRGWQLFEHGRAVGNGRGGMQRTVFKAQPRSKIKEWDGEDISHQRLLINGEQGIGDVMMFSMLIPPLFRETKEIGIVTYDRLVELYKRSFPEAKIFDVKDIRSGAIKPTDWDVQVAIGSLPMLRHSTLDDYQGLKPFLKQNEMQQQELKIKYYPTSTDETLIGFSWKGGGNTKQKQTKSLQLEDLLPLFKIPKTKWISLQYGDVNDEIAAFNKQHDLNLIAPNDVDPLKDMDRWCSLVSCCDQVISAANTTIHGAGCLGIPTTVILAKNPDWRWLGATDAKCYWYPNVSIARQRKVGSWDEPIHQVLKSLEGNFHYH